MAALNDSELMGWTNGTVDQCRPRYNYYAALLSLLIFTVVFGNVLVCLAVSRERALQTTTNYLIVSLAVADLLVATLVMPWVVYLEVMPPTSQPLGWGRRKVPARSGACSGLTSAGGGAAITAPRLAEGSGNVWGPLGADLVGQRFLGQGQQKVPERSRAFSAPTSRASSRRTGVGGRFWKGLGPARC
ncbi:hypothetical protein chiPu_0021710 [Chiloscyllium punctatum]|uniref:G-protein coupled receptors family 1 profile domain-containing protein n=1 Tax=Chiloscyllium punctatum TaxID=137246 RepID=A0A401RKR2_CHIPU|nr:hypothetical protein [Chiloscyllium punctatum]